jgi:hypothetical protein
MEELTIEEANDLVPTLHKIVSRLMLQKEDLANKIAALHVRTGVLPRDITIRVDDDGDVADLKREVQESLTAFEEGWAEVQALGGVVKDPKTGLVDFYGRVNGETVWLCWRFGEESIGHYHSLDEGFSARRPLPHAPPQHRILS